MTTEAVEHPVQAAGDQKKESDADQRPPESEQKPADGDQKLAEVDQKPPVVDQKPPEADQKPPEVDQKSADSDQKQADKVTDEEPAGGSGTDSDEDSVPELDDAQAQIQSQVSAICKGRNMLINFSGADWYVTDNLMVYIDMLSGDIHTQLLIAIRVANISE